MLSIVTLLREDLEKELRGVLPREAIRTFMLFLEQVQQLEMEVQAQRKLLMATAKVLTAVTKSDDVLKRFEEVTARNERNATIGVEAIKQGDEDRD